MKVSKINSDIKRLNFGQNKIYVYADFDRTISPNTTSDVFYATNKSKMLLAKYNFDIINDLIKKYQNLQFHIATGRSNAELRVIYDLYKRQGINFINANSATIKEGADEFLRDTKIKNDYPFTIKNQKRNLYIKNKTNWDETKIKNATSYYIQDENLDPLLCATTLSPEKYGKYSIFTYPEKITDKTVFIRDIGEFKLFLGFADNIPDEKYEKIKYKMINYLSQNNINFKIEEKLNDKECNNLRSITFIPIIDGEVLSKKYDIETSAKNMDETDTIIVAGDSKNDYPMLNNCSYSKDFKGNIISIIVEKKDEKEPLLQNLYDTHLNIPKRRIEKIEEGNLADKLTEIIKQIFND